MKYALEISDETFRAMQDLAEITGLESDTGTVARLVQDALRVYEWVLFQQVNQRSIVALERTDIEFLKNTERVHGERDSLDTFVPKHKAAKAHAYFQKAA